jgi:hypothetical protein
VYLLEVSVVVGDIVMIESVIYSSLRCANRIRATWIRFKQPFILTSLLVAIIGSYAYSAFNKTYILDEFYDGNALRERNLSEKLSIRFLHFILNIFTLLRRY